MSRAQRILEQKVTFSLGKDSIKKLLQAFRLKSREDTKATKMMQKMNKKNEAHGDSRHAQRKNLKLQDDRPLEKQSIHAKLKNLHQ